MIEIFILSEAATFDYEVVGCFRSMEKLLLYLEDRFGCLRTDYSDVDEFIEDIECKIEKSVLYD